ncbi:NUDIX domain-containing protein [Paracoccus aminophilus]|uniref:NUDIX hydrolase n=1 Tax=Paracoccus aminophilus JCM 7686 TaxID=1367847 RepID=S5Y1Z7_PARAH|nr:NUDIX hydrolase [Paracoccus aminophilus]AGT09760.1 NUDIX hydrolase [Paracoccus aminophilus JCM 7686]
MIPRFGEIRPDRHYRRRPGAYALLIRDHRALLTFQQAPEPEFQLPGGGIEPGEAPIPALHREVIEETGWTISAPRFFATYRRYCYMPDYDLWAEKLCSIWIARPILCLGPPVEAGHRAAWVDLAEVPALLPDPGSRDTVRRYLASL